MFHAALEKSVTQPCWYGSGVRRQRNASGIVDPGVGAPIHADKAGGLFDPSQPVADRRAGSEGVVATIRDVGVSIQRDIRDRELARGKILVGLEVILHHMEGGVAALHP